MGPGGIFLCHELIKYPKRNGGENPGKTKPAFSLHLFPRKVHGRQRHLRLALIKMLADSQALTVPVATGVQKVQVGSTNVHQSICKHSLSIQFGHNLLSMPFYNFHITFLR